MQKSCMSCGMPISEEAAKKGDYCEYCVDETGKLHTKERVQMGVAEWLKSWAKEKECVDFKKRAENYMLAMPAWSE